MFIALSLIFPGLNACMESPEAGDVNSNMQNIIVEDSASNKVEGHYIPVEFTRDSLLKQLKYKVENKIPLVVHIMVPLCDNENQGIVPVADHLGDGDNLQTNLYWACGHGMKAYFKNQLTWKLVKDELTDTIPVMERVVFKKEFENGALVYLVNDAYRGDKMNSCLVDFFDAVSGRKHEKMILGKDTIELFADADMIGFNGHNGLLEHYPLMLYSSDSIQREAVAIACHSSAFFDDLLKGAGGYPLVTTNGLLYPGAFIFDDIITEWANLRSGEVCRKAAGKAYHRVMDCGVQAGDFLFATGWRKKHD